MGLRVKECGKSESLAVMVKIGLALAIVTLVHAKAGRLPQGHNYEKDCRTFKEEKANDNESWCTHQQTDSIERH